ncbi:MAG: ribonuclease H-like domain-containing protein [Oligoflexus sp.]|nr:ribonuclease H-like domain-containing protein [Oligoflexus sp.]
MKRLGYAGGLKAIERQIGLDRGDLRSVDGFLAVALWQEYKRRKSETALETLLAYNCADVINLEQMMVMA